MRLLAGIPLVVHTIVAARASARVDRVLVSTDDPHIARIAKRAGAEVPFLRPAELASSQATTVAVVAHAVAWLEETGEEVDVVVTLQPTTPLRGQNEIDDVIALLDDHSNSSATTASPVGLPATVVGVMEGGRLTRPWGNRGDTRRQEAPTLVRLTGSVYATRRSLLASGLLLDDAPAVVITTGAAAIDIDDAADLRMARRAARALGGR